FMMEGDRRKVDASEAFEIVIGRQRSPKHQLGDHITPYLRSANVTSNGIDLDDVKSMNFTPDEQIKYKLQLNDVLVSEGSASAKAVGLPAVWRGGLEGPVCFQNTLLRYRAIPGVTIPAFVDLWCRWAFDSGEYLKAATGTNIYHIGSQGASKMKVRDTTVGQQESFASTMRCIADALASIQNEWDALIALKTRLLATVFGGAS
ncbi:MAG: hypothetical protein M3440_07875, partial [Chloroflexota bacterium]|nr:hypothetical protein [Chloroflexota bacterium]